MMSEILKKDTTLDFHTSSQKYKKFPLRVLLDNIRDEINVGSALRVSDALCVEHLHCGGENEGVSMKKLRRVSRGTDSHVPYSFTNDLLQTIRLSTEMGEFQVHSADLGPSLEFNTVLSTNFFLVFFFSFLFCFIHVSFLRLAQCCR